MEDQVVLLAFGPKSHEFEYDAEFMWRNRDKTEYHFLSKRKLVIGDVICNKRVTTVKKNKLGEKETVLVGYKGLVINNIIEQKNIGDDYKGIGLVNGYHTKFNCTRIDLPLTVRFECDPIEEEATV